MTLERFFRLPGAPNLKGSCKINHNTSKIIDICLKHIRDLLQKNKTFGTNCNLWNFIKNSWNLLATMSVERHQAMVSIHTRYIDIFQLGLFCCNFDHALKSQVLKIFKFVKNVHEPTTTRNIHKNSKTRPISLLRPHKTMIYQCGSEEEGLA